MRIRSLFITAGVSALLWGCSPERTTQLPPGDPPAPPVQVGVTAQGITATARANLANAIEGVLLTGEVMGENDFLRGIGFSDDASCTDPVEPGGMGGGGCEQPPVGERASEAAEDMADAMFHTDDVEEETATRVVYRLSADRVCDGADDGFREPNPNPPQVGSCEEAVNANPIRIAVTSLREGDLDAQILIGEARTPLARVQLYASYVDVSVDLANARAAFEIIAAASGEDLTVPTIVQGAISVRVTENGANDYTGRLAITRAIRIAETGSEPYSVELAAANPAWTVRLANNQQIESTTSFGALDLSGPLALFSSVACGDEPSTGSGSTRPGGGTAPPPGGDVPEPPPTNEGPCGDSELTGTLAFHLDALTSAITVGERVDVSNLSIGSGPATASYNGLPVAQFDLNTSMGRAIAANIGDHDDGLETRYRPGADLLLRLSGQHLANQLDVPEWAMDEEFSVRLDGAPEPTLMFLQGASDSPGAQAPPDPDGDPIPPPPPPPTTNNNAVLRVDAGTLALRSRATGLLTVPAGQCLHAESSAGDAPPTTGGGGNTGGGGGMAPPGPDPEPPTTGSDHPFGGLSAGPCE